METSALNFILRAFQGNWETDTAVEKTIRFLKEANFQGIMFWWGYGHWEPNHITDKVMHSRARRLEEIIPRFKQEGFSTGLNIHTVGFTYSPSDTHDFGFQYQVGSEGHPNRNSACPLSPEFQDYLKRLTSRFAISGLDYVFIDDDFDYMVPGSACYCPLHISAFSKMIGENLTRERWLKIIQSPDFKPNRMSEAWAKIQSDALLKAAKVIEDALHRRNPYIRLGLMGIGSWICNRGLKATNELLKIFRGPRNLSPVVRPSVGAYWDYRRWVGDGSSSHYSEIYLRTILPPDVISFIELDSGGPWTIFDHSAEHLKFVIERSLATGSRDFAFLIFPDSPGVAIPNSHPYTEMLRKNSARFEAIARLVGKNPVFEGVDCRTGSGFDIDPCHDHFFGIPAFSLSRIGLAMAPTGKWVTVLFGRQPLAIGRRNIGEYLSRGSLIDAGGIEALQNMGCSNILGNVRIANWDKDKYGNPTGAMSPQGSPVGLQMTTHSLNGSAVGQFFSNMGGLRKQCKKLVGRFRDEDVLSWWVDSEFKHIGPAEVVVENNGHRFVLLAYRLDFQCPDEQIFIANPIRQEMFHNVCEWLARRPLPGVVKNGADVSLFCMRSANGKRRILTLVNNGFNRFEELTVEVASLPESRDIIRTVNEDGIIENVRGLKPSRLKDRWQLKFRGKMVPGPMEVRLFTIE